MIFKKEINLKHGKDDSIEYNALFNFPIPAQADALPARVGSPYEKIISFVLYVNQELAIGYNAQTDGTLHTLRNIRSHFAHN